MDWEAMRKMPFCLNDEGIEWVQKTLESMTEEEKIGHLFCLCISGTGEKEIDELYDVLTPGAMMYRPMPIANALRSTASLRRRSRIPMLIAANLEKGGNGAVTEGTLLSSPMGIAATQNPDMGDHLGQICAEEASAVGVNWAFAPIIDIDYNFRNPITNTRTFGSHPEQVAELGARYVKRLQSYGMAASIKHFPGDGCDERDQHLVTGVNDKTVEEWDATYGMVYRRSIEAGAKTVMVGHIMQPAYTRLLNPGIRDEEIMPASLSSELLQGLLRGRLGFNGLIVTDATSMAGFTVPLPRSQAVPGSIAAGADMFLFTKNLREDYEYMTVGVREGVISQQRLDEAVGRILALKASLGLHKGYGKPLDEAEARRVIGCEQFRRWAEECADESITLVKHTQADVLPLSVTRTPRILLSSISSEMAEFGYSARGGVTEAFIRLLEQEGFQVDVFEPEYTKEGRIRPSTDTTEHYDVMLYLANMVTKSNQTVVRIEWQQPMGANCPHFQAMLPTVFISVENPYHLLDVPRVRTFINAYCSTDETLRHVVDKLMGRSPFKGVSPVDAFCGKWDAHL